MYQLILRGARLGDEVLDVGIEDGRVGRIAARIDERAEREIEAGGPAAQVLIELYLQAGRSRGTSTKRSRLISAP